MGKANMFYNAASRRWELRNRSGTMIAQWSDDGYSKDEQVSRLAKLRIAEGGTIGAFTKLTGTLTGIAPIGTGAVAVGTVTGVTGIAVGDLIHVMPKAALAGNIGFVGAYIPTTNTVNIYVANTKSDSAGSLVDVGVDLLHMRLAG